MSRIPYPLAALALFTGLLLDCSLSSSDPLPVPSLAGDAQLTILQTTDLHNAAAGVGHVAAGAAAATGSYARISAYVEYVRASAGHPVVLVDSGDWSMGTYYDLTLGQQPLPLLFMDAMRYDCATLGNHEFDYTPAGLALILASAQTSFGLRTPLVASNTELKGNLDLAPYLGAGRLIPPSRVAVLANGLKVGYIGLMGKDATGAAPASAPVAFTDYSLNYGLVQALVDDLRNNQHCNVVIALSHAGTDPTGEAGEDVNLARHVTGIDVIATGHMHNALASAHSFVNGAWTTRIICAGAYSSNVARIDLTYHAATRSTTVDNSSNPAMTDAGLQALHAGLQPDPAVAFIVGSVDQQLNAGLKDVFTKIAQFPDYSAADVAKGLYHPVGASAQAMVSNDKNPVLCPNGLGNLCADAVRAVPNGIIAQALLAQGWNGSPSDPRLPAILAGLQAAGFDPTTYAAAVVATGTLRAALAPGVALTFADLYNVLPLGTSPDTSQAIPIGYPLMSAYLTLGDLQKVFALQLVSQTNLTPSDYYLNLSGLRCTYKSAELNSYFKFATAAAVLDTTSKKAAAGSAPAGAALSALAKLATDSGAALLAAQAAGNPYAAAMAGLNDPAPGMAQIAANLPVLGQVAGAAASDAASAGNSLNVLIMGKAVAAVDSISGFASGDSACTGATAALTGSGRFRVAADLYVILMMGAAKAQFGSDITAYKAATGSEILSGANLAAAMGNRINLTPTAATVQETKEWMALLLYLLTPPAQGGHFSGGLIGPEYASTADFSQFGSFGAAVQVRAASYPIASIGQFATTLGGLKAAP